MSLTLQVEYEYNVHGKKAVLTATDLVTVTENTPSAIRRVLRLLHPAWESFKVISTSEVTPATR